MSGTSETSASRAEWIKMLLSLLRGLDGYFVKRGPIDWATFTWPKSLALSVRAAENFPAGEDGLRTTTLEIVAGARIQQDSDDDDDEVLEAIETDVITAMEALKQAKFKESGLDTPYVVRVSHLGSIELNGSEFGMQGWYITFTVEF